MSHDKKSTYYDIGEIETIDIIKAKLTHEQYTGFLLGNALKYNCRCNWKHRKKYNIFQKIWHKIFKSKPKTKIHQRDIEKSIIYLSLLQKDIKEN